MDTVALTWGLQRRAPMVAESERILEDHEAVIREATYRVIALDSLVLRLMEGRRAGLQETATFSRAGLALLLAFAVHADRGARS